MLVRVPGNLWSPEWDGYDEVGLIVQTPATNTDGQLSDTSKQAWLVYCPSMSSSAGECAIYRLNSRHAKALVVVESSVWEALRTCMPGAPAEVQQQFFMPFSQVWYMHAGKWLSGDFCIAGWHEQQVVLVQTSGSEALAPALGNHPADGTMVLWTPAELHSQVHGTPSSPTPDGPAALRCTQTLAAIFKDMALPGVEPVPAWAHAHTPQQATAGADKKQALRRKRPKPQKLKYRRVLRFDDVFAAGKSRGAGALPGQQLTKPSQGKPPPRRAERRVSVKPATAQALCPALQLIRDRAQAKRRAAQARAPMSMPATRPERQGGGEGDHARLRAPDGAKDAAPSTAGAAEAPRAPTQAGRVQKEGSELAGALARLSQHMADRGTLTSMASGTPMKRRVKWADLADG